MALRDPITVRGPIVRNPSAALLSKPVAAVIVLLLFGTALQITPGLEHFRLWSRPVPTLASGEPPNRGLLNQAEQKIGASELQAETRYRTDLAQPETAVLKQPRRGPIAQQSEDDFKLPQVDAETPPITIVDEERSLRSFFSSLAATARKRPQAITRILYHGDSLVASDYVTSTLRRKLQDEFGDAGHGFVLMADPWPAYFHNDIFRYSSRGFKVSRIVGPYAADGLYGVGGVSFKAPPGVRARFGTAEKGKYGRSVSLYQLFYLEQPHGGQLKINLDGQPQTILDTESDQKRSAVYELNVPDGPHMMEVVTAGKFTRTFGAVLERKVPGVVLDAIGIQGARLRFLDKQDDDHWSEQLKLRKPNLVVYQFGANESGDGFAYSMEDYHRTMKDVLMQVKRAVPDASCLVLAAMDRARKQGDYLITHPIIPHIVREQQSTAAEVGCAFFNTFEAMGGRGSMAKWVRRGLGQADMTHPTGYGAQVLGNWIYRALMQGYNEYLTRNGAAKPSTAPDTEPGMSADGGRPEAE